MTRRINSEMLVVAIVSLVLGAVIINWNPYVHIALWGVIAVAGMQIRKSKNPNLIRLLAHIAVNFVIIGGLAGITLGMSMEPSVKVIALFLEEFGFACYFFSIESDPDPKTVPTS